MKKVIIISSICLLFTLCSKEPGALQVPQQVFDSVRLIVIKNNIPADNYSYAEVGVIVKKRPSTNDQIVFTTDKGVFNNNSISYAVSVSSNDTTKAYVKYNKAEPVRITAGLFGKDTREVYITFSNSYPYQILVTPDSSSLLSSYLSKTKILSKSIRLNGTVMEGTRISYFDSIPTAPIRPIGFFQNATYSDMQGNASVDYLIQDTSYHGFVYVKALVDTSSNGKVIGIGRIFIR